MQFCKIANKIHLKQCTNKTASHAPDLGNTGSGFGLFHLSEKRFAASSTGRLILLCISGGLPDRRECVSPLCLCQAAREPDQKEKD